MPPLYDGGERFSHLISRRMIEIHNSTGDHLPKLRRRFPYSPAFMHPSDMLCLDIRTGDVIRIDSNLTFIFAIAEASPDVLPGAISMAHARAGMPDGDCSSTNRLVATDRDFEPISGIPRQSALPVNVRPLTRAELAAASS